MSMPIRAPLWISAGDDHLLSQEIGDQEWCLAFRAVTAQTDGAAEEIALRAATLADEAFTTARAFVHRLRHDRAATLEFLAPALGVDQGGLVAESESALLVRS